MTDHVLYEVRDGLALVTLNRPEKLNAMTLSMDGEWAAALRRANDDPGVGAILVTGAGRAFCAGADFAARFQKRLDEIAEGGPGRAPTGTHWVRLVRESKPVIAAVNGACIGMGLTLILCFDTILASDRASFAAPFVKIGLVPELNSTHFLVSRMGFGKASEFALTGRTMTAAEAVASGLADRLVPHDRLMEEAFALGALMAANPAPQLRMTKRLLTQNAVEQDLDLVASRELEALEQARRTPEHTAAVARFLKR